MNIQEFEKELDICLKKLNKEIDLDWIEIVDELGLDIHYDSLRRVAYGYRKYHEYIQLKGSDSIGDDMYNKLLEKEIEIKKLMTKLSDMRALVNKDIRSQSRYEHLLEIMSSEIKSLNNENPFYNINHYDGDCNLNRKEMVIALSDIHYGLCVDDKWNLYNSKIAIERMNKIVDKSMSIGKLHGCKIVHLMVCGDVLNNNIHLTSRLPKSPFL